MSEERDALIERIQKLLALSERNGSVAEAESAARKAQELLTQYNLELDDVQSHAAKAKQLVVLVSVEYPNACEPWERTLHSSVAAGFYCKPIISANKEHAYFVGRESNAKVASYIFEQLATRLPVLANAAFKAYTQEWKVQHGKSFWTSNRNIPAIKGNYVRNWLLGAVTGLYEQLKRQQESAEASRALVISVNTENDEFIAGRFARLKEANKVAQPTYNRNAYDNGLSTGKTMNIHQGLETTERKQIQ